MNPLVLFEKLFKEMPSTERLERLVDIIQSIFQCGAVALLKLEGTALKPVATKGLVAEVMGRKFIISQHPRLSALATSPSALRFPLGSPLPDPYDGLLLSQPGTALPVHDCMGMQLSIDDQCWGILTLDSLMLGAFNSELLEKLESYRPTIEAVIRLSALEDEIQNLRSTQSQFKNNRPLIDEYNLDAVGNSETVQQVLKELEAIATSDLPVLMLGESGVRKDVFANFLHRKSNRSHKPLIHVNCAALTENTIESELFGHTFGAFSGANTERMGKFEAAHLGTLFLDEIGALPLPVQATLLRFLQTGELRRVGSDSNLNINIRLVAATNRNLKELVLKGQFRADLFHRLSVYPVPIPPLRERTKDIQLIAGYFLELNRARLGVRSLHLSADAEEALLAYSWPGNTRELEHAISRAAIKALSTSENTEDIITLDSRSLDLQLPNQHVAELLEHGSGLLDQVQGLTMKEAVKVFQKALILKELQQQKGSWSATARAFKLDPSNLHKLAVKIGIK